MPINPLTGKEFGDNTTGKVDKGAETQTAPLNPLTGKPYAIDNDSSLAYLNNSPVEQVKVNPDTWKEYKRLTPNAFAGDELMQQKLSANQSSGEQVANTIIGGSKLFAAGVVDGIAQWDLSQAYDMLKGANQEYGNAFHEVANKLRTSAQENNPIYEQDPGSVNPSDAGWWMNQGQQLAYSMGLAAEAMGEQVILGATTAGIGNVLSEAKAGKTFLTLAREILPTLTEGQKVLMNNAAFGFGKGVQEGYLNGLNTYEETKKYYQENGFSEEQANQFASKAASEAYNKEVVVNGVLKALEFSTLSYNPLSKESRSILDGISNTTARTVAKVGTEIGLQGFEEGYQNVVSNEGRYTADRLSGLTTESAFGDRLKNYMSDSKMWNEVIGGMFGGAAFVGLGAIRDKVGGSVIDKFKANQYEDFKGKREAMTLDYVNEIGKLKAAGRDNEAQAMQRIFAQNLGLSAYHLDRINGIDQGGEFDSHVSYLQGMIDAVNSNNEEQLKTYGITTDAQKKQVLEAYPSFIEDANRMKSIYDQEADYNSPSALLPIVSREFQKEKYQTDLAAAESRVSELGSNFLDMNELTDTGKLIYDLQLDSDENNRILANAMANPVDDPEYNNFVQALKAKAGILDQRIGTLNINQDESRTQEELDSDNNILDSISRNNEYVKNKRVIDNIKRELNKIRKELKTWRGRDFQKKVENRNLFGQIANTQTLEELQTLENGLQGLEKQTREVKGAILKRKGQIQAAITAKERAAMTTAPEANTETVPRSEEISIPVVEVSPEQTDEKIASDLAALPKTEGTHESKRKEILGKKKASEALEEKLFDVFEPTRDYTNEFADPTNSNDGLTQFKDYLKSLSEIIGKTPGIDDVIVDMKSDPEFNDSDEAFVKDMYNKYRQSIHNGLRSAALRAARSNTPLPNNVVNTSESINSTQSGWNYRQSMQANADALVEVGDNSPKKSPIYLGNKITIPTLKLAMLNLPYVEKTGLVDGEQVSWYETSDLNDLKAPQTLDYNKINIGTKLTVRVNENTDVYNNERNIVPFNTLGLDPSTSEYWERVPIEVVDQSGKVIEGVYIHDPAWYNERNVALINNDIEQQAATIEEGKANVRAIRNKVRENPMGLTLEVTSRSMGTKEFIQAEWNELPTLNQNNPTSELGYVTKTEPLAVKVGEKIYKQDRVLGLDKLLPGSPVEIREVSKDKDGPLYMASYPLRNNLSSDSFAIKSIQSAFQVYMTLVSGIDTFINMSREQAQSINNTLIKDYGLDLSTPNGINTYMGMILYIRNEAPSDEYIKSLPEGQAVAFFENGVLHFAKNMTVNGQLYKRDISPKTLIDNPVLATSITQTILSNIQHLPTNVTNNDGQPYHSKMPFIINNQVITYKSPVTNKTDYQSFLKDTMKTNIKSWNIGTQSAPNYKTFVQSVITIAEVGTVDNRSTAEIPQQEVMRTEVQEANDIRNENLITNFDQILFDGMGRVEVRGVKFDTFDVVIDQDSKTAEVGNVQKSDPTTNRGVGLQSYIELGNRLKENGITLVSSSSNARNQAGVNLWNTLVDQRYAEGSNNKGYTFTGKIDEADKLLRETLNMLNSLGLNDELMGGADIYEPSRFTQADISLLTANITDIPGLTEKDRNDISNWMLATIFTNLNNRYGDSFSREEFDKEVDIKFEDYFADKLKAVNTQRNAIVAQLNKAPHEGLSNVLVTIEGHISDFNIVKENWNTLKTEVLELELDKYVSFREVTVDTNDINESSDSVGENNQGVDQETVDQEQVDDMAENGPKYDTPGYQENYKNSVSLFVKRYLFAIPQYKRGSQANETKKGFLGVNTYESFENNYNVLMDLISGKSQILSDTEDLKDYLSNPEAIPEQFRSMTRDVVKLIDNNFQFDQALQYAITKANVNLLMVMEQTNNKTGATSLKVYNVNSNEVIQTIMAGWREGHKHSNLITWNQEDITYNNIVREKLIGQYNSWLEKKSELPLNMAEFRGELNTWFKDMGILLHPKTINNLLESGYSVKDPSGKSIKLTGLGLFTDGRGIFNIIGEFLKKTINLEKSNPDIISNPGINLFDAETNSIRILANINKQFMGFVPTNSFRDNGKSIYGYENLMLDKQINIKIKNDETYRAKKLATIFEKDSYVLQAVHNSEEVRNAFALNTAAMTAIKMQGKDNYGNWKVKDLSDIDYERFDYGSFMHKGEDLKYKVGNIKFRMANILSLVSSDKERRNMDYIPVPVLDTTYFNLEGADFGIGDGVNAQELNEFLFSQLVEPELNRMISHFNETKVKGVSPNTLYNQKDYNYGAQMFLMIPELNNMTVEGQRIIDYLTEETEINKDFIVGKIKDQAISIINNYIAQQAKGKYEKWIEYFSVPPEEETEKTYSMLREDGTTIDYVTINHMDDSYMKKFGQDKEKQIKGVALEYTISMALANANHFMLYLGDVANFAQNKFFEVKNGQNQFFEVDEKGNIMIGKPLNDNGKVYEDLVQNNIGVNLGKRAAMLIAPGSMLANSKDDGYVQLFINDSKRVASNIGELINLFYTERYTEEVKEKVDILFRANQMLASQQREGKIDPSTLNRRNEIVDELSKSFPDIAAYFEIESTDAQEYTTWKEHLDIILRQGRMSEKQYNSIYDSLSKGKQLDTKDLKVVFQPIKPVFTGKLLEDIGNGTYRNRSLYIKSSSFPLLPQLTQGTEFDGLRKDMEALQKSTGKNVRASYETANKVGSVSKPITIWDEEGRYIPNALGDLDLMTSDLHADRLVSAKILPREYFRIQQDVPFKSSKKTKDEISIGTQMMKVLFSDEVKELLGDTAFNQYQQAFIDWNNNEVIKLRNDLGVDENGNIAVQKLRDLLLKEAQQRNYTKQDIQILSSVLDTLEFESPLWLSANSNRYEAFMNAIIGARLINLKLPGASFVSGSEEGWVGEATESYKKGEIVYTKDWTGKLKDNEALIPSKFRINGKLIDLRSDEWSTVDQYGTRKLKEDKFDKELLSITGFRIPTSGHVSGSQLKIVGFLPYNAGDLSIVSKNLTKQMGQDFDVDKLNTYWLHHQLNEDGVIIGLDADTSTDISKVNQNVIIRTHSKVFGSKDARIQRKIQKVLSTEFAEDQADMITSLTSQANSETIFSILSPEYQKNKMILGAVGKSGIGVYSNYVTFHGLSQQTPVPVRIAEPYLDPETGEITLESASFRIGNHISDGVLGRIYTLDGDRTIADVFAERQNTATDNEKLQVLGRVGVDNNTINFDSLISALGFDKDTFTDNGEEISINIPYFILSQPIMKDYVEAMKNANSQIAEFDPDKKNSIKLSLFERYGMNDDMLDELMKGDPGRLLTGKSLYDSLRTNRNTLSEEGLRQHNLIQLASLMTFIKYNEIAEKIQQLQSHLNIQRSGLGKSFFEAESKMDNLLKLLSGESYGGKDFQIVNTDGYIGQLTDFEGYKEGDINLSDGNFFRPTTPTGIILGNGIKQYNDLFRQFFPQQSTLFNETVDNIISSMGADGKATNKKVELKNQVLLNLKKFVLSTGSSFIKGNVQEERARLLFDNENNQSLADYLYKLKYDSQFSNIIAGNSLLSQFEFKLNKDNEPSLIVYRNSRGEDIQEEYKYKALISLLADNPVLPDYNGSTYSANQLVTDLVAYSYLIGGVQEANEFIKYIPVSILQRLGITSDMRTIHNILKSNDSDAYSRLLGDKGEIFEQQFFQHNPKRARRLTEDQITNINTKNFTERTTGFSIKEDLIKGMTTRIGLPKYVSIYNEGKKGKGNNKYQLYRLVIVDQDNHFYERLPLLGASGMVEYSNIARPIPLIDKTVGYGIINQKVDPRPIYSIQTNQANPFSIKGGDITKTVNEIIGSNIPSLSPFLEALKPYINPNTKLVIDNNLANINGAYQMRDNVIIFNDASLTRDKVDVARTFVKEYMHSITAQDLLKYYNYDKLNKTSSLKGDIEIPLYVQRLNRLYNDVLSKLEDNPTFKSMQAKRMANEGLTDEEFATYGALNIFEFVSEIFGDPAFQETLANTPYKQTGDSMLQYFKKVLLDMLRFLGVKITDTQLAEGIDATLQFITEERKAKISNPVEGISNLGLDNNITFRTEQTTPNVSAIEFELNKSQINQLEIFANNDYVNEGGFVSQPFSIDGQDITFNLTNNQLNWIKNNRELFKELAKFAIQIGTTDLSEAFKGIKTLNLFEPSSVEISEHLKTCL